MTATAADGRTREELLPSAVDALTAAARQTRVVAGQGGGAVTDDQEFFWYDDDQDLPAAEQAEMVDTGQPAA